MEVSNMEAGQLLVLLLSFCALALHIKNRRRKD
nr:MAG TPA: chitin synthase regulator [Bacteriophage sp.]